jgi:formylglycine-generating enzyme required for sulfatase activity
MAWVAPVKDFQMGSTGPAALPNEKPTFKVTLTRPFAIGTHEVTYKEFFAIAGYYVKYGSAIGRRSCTACGTDNSCPISHLTWDQAAAYTNLLSQKYGLPACYNCNPTPTHRKGTTPWPGTCTVKAAWQGANFSLCPGFRLPTEAEWEVAYRAGSKGDFYTGQICTSEQHCDITKSTTSIDIRSIAWYTKDTAATCSTHYGRIKKVGLKQPNAWGLFDMAGNVWEWTHDVYAGYTSTPKRDPSGPQTGPSRTLRGGCVDTSQAFLRASSRMAVNHPPQKDSVPRIYAGFRVARSVIGEFYCKTDADCTITVDKLYCINNTCRAQTTNKEPTGEPTTNVDAGLSQPD